VRRRREHHLVVDRERGRTRALDADDADGDDLDGVAIDLVRVGTLREAIAAALVERARDETHAIPVAIDAA